MKKAVRAAFFRAGGTRPPPQAGCIALGIYGFAWTYGMQNRLRDKAGRMGTGSIAGGGTILLWQIFGSLLFGLGPLVGTYIQIHSINTVVYASQAAQNRQVEQRMNSAAQGF